MLIEQLREKAARLPAEPGVYLMKDSSGTVIYVGKAKKLRNRVSQYFQENAAHSAKTKLMVSKIDHFEVIVAASEFEALVLECAQIKQYMPKYNILLKDDKGYPYLRLNMNDAYPRITMVSRIDNDGANYFGPYGSRSVTNDLLQTIIHSLKLPDCSRKFPRDIGKDRPCLNYHMGQCAGWCQTELSQAAYREIIEEAKQLLTGNYKQAADKIRKQMLQAADELNFELAASLRNRLNAIEALGEKQLVTAGRPADTDVIGFAATETKACFTVLHFSGGSLQDKEYEVLPAVDDPHAALTSLVKQYYLSRGFAPKIVLLPFAIDDQELFAQLLAQRYGRKTQLKVPQRGDFVRLVELAEKNAKEEAERITGKEEKAKASLSLLGKMLSVPTPERIESFDISNISGTDIVASMVVFQSGKPRKSEYKRFKIEGLDGQDDYASMRQVLTRRFRHYISGDKGFDILPELLLIDGGTAHAHTALEVLSDLGISVPVFGMVKDDKHRTRALVTPQGAQIAIDNQPSVFSLIGTIQEETHRFAITYHRQLRSKRLRYSELDKIPGIGPKRKQDLLKQFKSISAIRQASLPELERILPKDAAMAIYNHFQNREEG